MGISAKGINREMSATLECATLCRSTGAKPLAIPETAILKLAQKLATRKNLFPTAEAEAKNVCVPLEQDILKGILPCLRYVISRQTRATEHTLTKTDTSQFLEDEFSFDPKGSDYYCKICSAEIANEYYQCQGCFELLDKEFNICFDCHSDKKYLKDIPMRLVKKQTEKSPYCHHLAQVEPKCRGPCKKEFCVGCLHRKFSRHLRFYSDEGINELLSKCEAKLDDNGADETDDNGDEVEYADETFDRLNKLSPAG